MNGVTWGWTARHPGTGREVDTETWPGAIQWFAYQTVEWAARRYVLPYLLAVVVVGVVVWRGVRS